MSAKKVLLASTPALIVYCVLYLYWILSGQRFDAFMNWEDPVQTLNSDALRQFPVEALSGQHAQPPLYMFIKLAGLQFGEGQVVFWQAVWFGTFAIGVVALVGSFLAARVGTKWAGALGALYVLIPGTAKYSLWGYTTVLVSTLLLLVVFGLALLWRGSRYGAPIASVSVLLLVLLRSYFVWVIGVVLLGLVVWQLLRTRHLRERAAQWILVVACLVGVLAAQFHYWNSFGLMTMSSLGPSNLNRGLLSNGLTDAEKRVLSDQDKCLADVVAAGPFASAESVPNCRSHWENRRLSTTQAAEAGEAANSLARLQGSFAQQYFFSRALLTFPTAPFRQLLGDNPSQGALGSYLGTTAGLTGSALILQAFFPILALLLVLVCSVVLVAKRRVREVPGWIWIATGLLIIQTFASVWGEFPENLRIRAEGHGLLYLVPALLVFHVWRNRGRQGTAPGGQRDLETQGLSQSPSS